MEYPQKYGQHLYNDVKKWGDRILAEITKELAPFYPEEPDNSEVCAYVWARTLPCQNLNCNAVIPLMSQFWLAQDKKKKKKIALFPYNIDGHIAFRIVGTGRDAIPDNFDPTKGTIIRAIVTCPLCNSTITANQTRQLFQNGQTGERMLAVVTQHPKNKAKQYRLATDKDVTIFKKAQKQLSEKRKFLMESLGFDPVPDELIPKLKGSGAERGISIHNYNFNTYGDLFNSRQQLTLITLTEKIRDAYVEMLAQTDYDPEYAKAISTYLGLWLDRIADKGSNLCLWRKTVETVEKLFGMATLPMIWNYGEANTLHIARNRLKTIIKPLLHLCQMDKESAAIVEQVSAQNLPYSDNTFDAVLTDPPYYDNAAYSYLSDFFYVWLKRSIGEHYPELFKDPLTPKDEEIVAYGHREGGLASGKQAFEDGLAKAFQEIYRVLKPNGITVIVYAHKSTEGWETLINALLNSGLVVTAAWPIDTEKKSRLRAINSAVLASSIYMVARKQERQPFGLYQDVKAELEKYLEQKLFTLWEWGFSGADLFIAAIGSGIETFGRYETVIDENDKAVRADQMITDIREILERFDNEGSGTAGTSLTRFYLRWRQEHGEQVVLYNDARELAMSLGIELQTASGEGRFIQQEKTNVHVLGPHEREIKDVANSYELIDILHHTLQLWALGNRAAMIQRLSKDSIGLSELIWNIAQQISKTLSTESQERQWLEGWLADRTAIQREVQTLLEQPEEGTLFRITN
ncbi:MAG: DNA methylase [Candidatus Poribacteria bacterium]|nr:DNA methylase [Candidatus Poribacteria bacterium]